MVAWNSRRKHLERWVLARIGTRMARSKLLAGAGLLVASVSVAVCAVTYWATGLVPATAIDRLVAYGLPFALPLIGTPIVLALVLKLTHVLSERSTQLEEEVRLRRRAEARLAILVSTDELTQVANRRAFFARATEIAEGSGGDATVAVMDLDAFKQLNDTRGHAAGDAELRRCGEILNELVNVNGLAARLGGEEFGLLLPHRDALTAKAFLDELRAHIGTRCAVTVSIGVADWPAGTAIDGALAAADAALYRAKQRGRNRVEIATADDAVFGTDMEPVARR